MADENGTTKVKLIAPPSESARCVFVDTVQI